MRVVLLHALGASGASWREVVAALGDGFASEAPDLPGFGDEPARDGGVAATVDWIAGRIASGGGAPYLLVGHSMGGKFATILASRAEAGAAGLAGLAGVVLLAGSPPAPEPMEESRRAEMIGWFADGPPSEADARRFVEANIAAPLLPAPMERAVADVRRALPSAWITWLQEGACEDWSDRVGRLDVPALIVVGGEDGDLGAANQRRLNLPHYPHGRVEVVAGAAHLLPYERPEEVARLIAGFARTLG